MVSADTDAEAEAVQFDAFRRMTPQRRVEVAVEMTEEAMAIAAAGIRDRHPDYNESLVAWAVKRLRLGDDDLFRAVWPHAPLVGF